MSYNLNNISEGTQVYLNNGGFGRFKVTTKNNHLTVGEGVRFQRVRRVTGYLVGTLDRFNNGKRAEEHDRVKHMSV